MTTPLYNADGNEGGGDGDDGNDGTDKRTVTMTQAELDALIGREKGRATKKYADYDDLKAERDRLKSEEDARKAASMTEQERLQAERDEAVSKATEATEAATNATTAANQRIVRTEFRLLAKEAGVRADALDDAFKLADTTSVTVGEDGEVVGVSDVIAALIAAKPYLAEVPKKEPRQIGEPSNYPPNDAVKTLEQQLEDAKQKRDFSKVIEISNKLKAIISK